MKGDGTATLLKSRTDVMSAAVAQVTDLGFCRRGCGGGDGMREAASAARPAAPAPHRAADDTDASDLPKPPRPPMALPSPLLRPPAGSHVARSRPILVSPISWWTP